MIGINIKKYRIRNNLSLRDLAEKLGISHTAVSKFEKDELIPNSTTLIELANIFKIKVADLFKNPQEEIQIKNIHYRKKSTLTRKSQEIIEDITKEELNKYLELIDLLPENRFKKVDLKNLQIDITNYDDIEEKVLELRKKLNLGIDPISNLLELVEGLGFIVIFIDDIRGFDGKEGIANGVPFIVLSKDKSGDRQRNSLAHELGHLLIKHDGLDDEKVANHFAGAFLIPNASLINDLGEHRNNITYFELEKLKRKYKVSMQSIIYRACQLGIISEFEKTKWFKKFSTAGFRTHEPIDIEIEKSDKFEQMICEAVSEGYISESKAAEYLNIKTLDFVNNYLGSELNGNN